MRPRRLLSAKQVLPFGIFVAHFAPAWPKRHLDSLLPPSLLRACGLQDDQIHFNYFFSAFLGDSGGHQYLR